MSATANLVQQSVQQYITIRNAFEQCDPQIQEVISSMLVIYNDEEASEREKKLAINTIVEALFPGLAADVLTAERSCAKSDKALSRAAELDAEEQFFADRVRNLLKDRQITQEDLADRIGVSQPAIANMLNRQCRPQQRTVARVAEALGVSPSDLWPAKSTATTQDE